jgi:general stress protein 26
MDKKDLDFERTLQEKFELLETGKRAVLSTCSNDRVTSRVVDIAFCDNTIYFLTWSHHTKCIQIMENPKVAICYKNLQIEGLAEIKGSPLLKSNKLHSAKYMEKQPNLYDQFVKFDGMVIVKVDITSINSWEDWDEESKGFFISIIDIPNKMAFKINAEDQRIY